MKRSLKYYIFILAGFLFVQVAWNITFLVWIDHILRTIERDLMPIAASVGPGLNVKAPREK